MSGNRIAKLILLHVPYVFIFWFCCKLGEAYRIAPGDLLPRKLMGITAATAAATENLMPSFHPDDTLVGIIGTPV